ncbi:hypothetical protein K2173_020811 [Erythroxylum novogranatense]|uniref:MORF/ORRM1/DAG-like MORF domain-containing protein n=1 Tax=Erythroxylum novogranatense TaxID=1862640 RepID=A0AAV8TLW0_9ROSI|nr:hypothetical protein K2173_020811 [Erythroxylum novogranatense]
MALRSFQRLRRPLTKLSRSLSSPIVPTAAPPPLSKTIARFTLRSTAFSLFQSRLFTGSPISLSPERQYKLYKEGDEITEDTVLFEGCDFNHWLITMDFPKDPKPTPEEMVATYERTCAQGLNISIEEAKKRMYACSTTTYQGFQAIMTEEESEKFKDVPGVVFVLPDSYIDPVNKEYGGKDKYENGFITPRPPPIQYQRGGRFRDRNRNADQPRYDRQGGSMQNRQGNPQFDQQAGGRYYGPPQNYPQQNYGPPQNVRPQQNYNPPNNYPPQQNYGPPQNYSRSKITNYPQQQNYRPSQNYPQPQGQADRVPMNNNYQANPRGPMHQYEATYSQGQHGDNYPRDQRSIPQDQRGFPSAGNRDFGGDNRSYSTMIGGTHWQGANSTNGQYYPGGGEASSQVKKKTMQGVQENFSSVGQTGADQLGKYFIRKMRFFFLKN